TTGVTIIERSGPRAARGHSPRELHVMTDPARHLSRCPASIWGVFSAAMLLAGCDGSQQETPQRPAGVRDPAASASSGDATHRREIRFIVDGLEFDAVIDAPDTARANRWGVLLIGGGLGNDIDWTTPGRIDNAGQSMQMTISGEEHADAPLLSAALTRLGCAVLRWTTIARGDPLADQWPIRATPRTLPELVAQTRGALAALRGSGLVDHDRIILVGHSLGAARACTVASDDAGVRALVLLSPAYFIRTESTPRAFMESGMMHGADLLRERQIPCLILLGSLDTSRAVNGSAILSLAGAPGYKHVNITMCKGMGHHLGPERGGQNGPIDPSVLGITAEWIGAVAQSR
ncbi:MAG: hypothetical protein L6Q35_16810, partial [Phycisphaerales bacterium]|nr:hypothetical protein [Phycisphaerales bacterium]